MSFSIDEPDVAEACAANNSNAESSSCFTLNGKPITFQGGATQRLSTALREKLNSRDVKVGCNAGDCGACTVLVDGEPVCACLTAVGQVQGKAVDTLAGLKEDDDVMKSLLRSFLVHGAAQCGICTPGMLVSALHLLRQTPYPNEQQVMDSLGVFYVGVPVTEKS